MAGNSATGRPRWRRFLIIAAACVTLIAAIYASRPRALATPNAMMMAPSSPLPAAAAAPASRPPSASSEAEPQRLPVTIRALHSGLYWQVVGSEEAAGQLRLAATANPSVRGSERTVFMLESEGTPGEGGWMLVRWLKTRQLVEVVPPGVPGREDDVWSVVLSRTDGVTELHKLLIEDEPKHARSYVWSVALKGYLNTLEAGGEIVAHADALPLRAAELPPLRGAVAVERLQGGASWLLQALEQRDAQIQGLRLQLAAAKSEIAAVEVIDPTVSRSGDERGRRGRRRGMRTRARGQDDGGSDGDGTRGREVAAEADVLIGRRQRRRPHAHVACAPPQPTAAEISRLVATVTTAAAVGVNESSDGSGGGYGGGGAGFCASDLPAWSYMSGGEYAKFVKAIASRLRLSNGDLLLELAADCGGSLGALQQLYRGRLNTLSLYADTLALARAEVARAAPVPLADGSLAPMPGSTNSCVSAPTELKWLPGDTFDAIASFGAFAAVRSRRQLCAAFRETLRALRPGGRLLVADAEHAAHCTDGSSGGIRSGHGARCASCHWAAVAPVAFWHACAPIEMEVLISVVEHSELGGTGGHECAAAHFALLALRSSAAHELAVTVEAGSDGGRVGVLLSLSQHSSEMRVLRRVRHLKELSIDNKRMFCGLHGYSLVIGEDLHHWREAEWDAVKLLSLQLSRYDWLLWTPLDSLFVDAATSLDGYIEGTRAQLIVPQDVGGDGGGTGALSAPLLLRGKSDWSARLLQEWWSFYADGYSGGEREALGMLLQGMHEEERAQHVRFVDVGGWLTPVGEAEPLPWQLPYHSTALLADFDPRRGGDACPDPATDRQLLGCLHTYASYHLKALQAADGRYHTPRAFDVVSVTDDAPAGTPGVGIGGGAATAADRPRAGLRARTPAGKPAAVTSKRGAGSAVVSCAAIDERGLPSRLSSSDEATAAVPAAGGSAATLVQSLCSTGSTWRHMPRARLAQFVKAFGARLGIQPGMNVLDAGAACGHALGVLQEVHRGKLHAVGIDGNGASVRYARRTVKGTFCVGDVRELRGIADETFDVAFTAGTLSLLRGEDELCAAARELGRVLKPGARALVVSIPKPTCATTQDRDWDCPRCYWRIAGIDKSFWANCLARGGQGEGAYRLEFLSNTELFPGKPAAYCHREHYSLIVHKKAQPVVHVYEQPRSRVAVLTVASTPPIGEYGKQKVHYLAEMSIENKRQYAAQHGYELVVAQNLRHGRTARWDKVMLLRRLLHSYEWLHWVDLDTLFMNMKRAPFDFLDSAYDLHVAKDANGLNTGSFYVRSSAWSEDFLRRVWEHNDGGAGESDQRSIRHTIEKLSDAERGAHVKFYSQKLFNEYPDPIVNFKNWRGHFRCGSA